MRLLPSAALAVLAGLTLTTAAHAATLPDPTVADAAVPVTKVLYDEGPTLIGGPGGADAYAQELQGSVHFPTTISGKLPVLVFLHGRHSTCSILGVEAVPLPQCPTDLLGGTVHSVDSYQGYDYLAQNLASHGFVVASIDANEINSSDLAATDAGAMARAQIMAKSLDLLSAWNTAAGPAGIDAKLVGHLDLGRIGIMGHSRGGEGVSQFIAYNRVRPATPDPSVGLDSGPRYPGLKAVFSLAPIDAADQAPTGVHFATLLPLCDGDVSDLSGSRPFERTKDDAGNDGFARIQFGVQGTDHNYYNTIWTSDDQGSTTDTACSPGVAGNLRLSAADQRDVGTTLMPAFFRRYVAGETAFDPYMTGEAPLPAVACSGVKVPTCDDEVQVSYFAPKAERRTIVAPGATDPTTRTASGGAIAATGLTAYGVCTSTGTAGCPGNGQATTINRSTTRQLSVVWDAPSSLAISLAGAGDARAFGTLTLRAGANYPDTARNPKGVSQDFAITLTDGSGHSATVPAKPYARGGLYPDAGSTADREVLLSGIRVPLAAFSGVDLGDLRTLTLGFGTRTPKGSIELADVRFQEPATAAGGTGTTGDTGTTGTAGPGSTDGPGTVDGGTVDGGTQTGGGAATGDGATTAGGAATGGAAAAGGTPDGAPPASSAPSATPVPATAPGTSTAPATSCRDTLAPVSRFTRARLTRTRLTLAGTSRDLGCGRLKQVRIAFGRAVGSQCRWLTATGRFSAPTACTRTQYLPARGTTRWTFSRRGTFPRGASYKVFVRGIDRAGNTERKAGARTFRGLRVR